MGERVNVAGYRLAGGVYVGCQLPDLCGRDVEPALISPHAGVDRSDPDVAGTSVGYWSYSRISPRARAAYLTWLAAGRPGGAYIGYVFLWFYGVERRVLVDAMTSPAARSEAPALIAEVERLLSLYSGDRSFRTHATNFLGAARLIAGARDPTDITPPVQPSGCDLPVEVKVGLGTLIANGTPLPPEWALAWVMCHPATRLRTPVTRCTDMLARLFAIRYRDQFGDGLKVRASKTPLTVDYHPASASFGGNVTLSIGVPDVTGLTAPLDQLRTIVQGAVDALDAYGRHLWLGGDPDSPAARALLPAEILADGTARAFADEFAGRLVGAEHVTVDAADLVARWPSVTPGTLTKKEAGALADLLASAGVGLEPDIRSGGANLSRANKAVIFRLPAAGGQPLTERFTAATVLLHVGSAVAMADGTVTDDQERHLATHLESLLHLNECERVRLRAHLQWLLAEPPALAGMKERLEALSDAQRHQIGQSLISVASADGHVDRAELMTLGKLYRTLGLDPDSVLCRRERAHSVWWAGRSGHGG